MKWEVIVIPQAVLHRQRTRRLMVGAVPVGGGAQVSIQSMTNTNTADVQATLAQIHALETAGCEIVRVAVPDMEAARAIGAIRAGIHIPLVADIHFDGRLAVAALEAGADKLRINPGNLPDKHLDMLLAALKARPVPVRVGVNAGSLPKDLLAQLGMSAETMVQAALRHVRLLEDAGFYDCAVSLKAPDVLMTVQAYRRMAELGAYPLHVGVTHASTAEGLGLVKSAMGIGAVLLDGIGDTLRVSLTGDPVQEVAAGQAILAAAGIRRFGVEIIACPTCGRCRMPIEPLVRDVEARLAGLQAPLTVAVMGCEVNGPGEARHADIGIAGSAPAHGEAYGVLFCKGELVQRYPVKELVDRCVDMAFEMAKIES